VTAFFSNRGRRIDTKTVMRRRIWNCPFCMASRTTFAGNALAATARLMGDANKHIAEAHPEQLDQVTAP
jgi:hypothetical protein